MSIAARTSLLQAAIDSFTVPPATDDGLVQWNVVAAQVDAMVHTDAAVVNNDPQEMADRVVAIVGAVRDDKVLYGRFKAVAATGEFDFEVFSRLLVHAPALWYARHRQRTEENESAAVVPEATVNRAVEVRNRMARLARYHFEDHPEEAMNVATLTLTRDRLQLANELLTAAEVYARQDAIVRNDRRFIDSDAAEARELSSQIRRSLGGQHDTGVRWVDRVAVLFGLVQRDYGELRALGQWLLRRAPDEAKERLPPLVIRSAPRAKVADTEPADEAVVEKRAEDVTPANDAAPKEEPKPAAPVVTEAEKPAVVTATKPRAAKAKKGRG